MEREDFPEDDVGEEGEQQDEALLENIPVECCSMHQTMKIQSFNIHIYKDKKITKSSICCFMRSLSLQKLRLLHVFLPSFAIFFRILELISNPIIVDSHLITSHGLCKYLGHGSINKST